LAAGKYIENIKDVYSNLKNAKSSEAVKYLGVKE